MDDWKKNPLAIDPHRLDWELWRQPKLVYTWTKRAADATQRVGEAKAALDVTEAELMLHANKDPAAFGLDKTTGPLLEAAVTNSKAYRRAVKALVTARHEEDVTKAMVTGLDHKKRTLEKGVDLFLAGYFAEPRVKAESAVKMRETGKRTARKPLRG